MQLRNVATRITRAPDFRAYLAPSKQVTDITFDSDYGSSSDIAYGGGKFVAVGAGGEAAYSNNQE
jgi:hypothetical protein